MKRLALALCVGSALAVGGCATGYGYDEGIYADGPYAYDGFYDGFYGPIYDGYWGDNGSFYYRHGAGDRRFHRGGHAHFSRGPAGGNFQHFHGTMSAGHGMHTPHFGHGGSHRRGGHR